MTYFIFRICFFILHFRHALCSNSEPFWILCHVTVGVLSLSRSIRCHVTSHSAPSLCNLTAVCSSNDSLHPSCNLLSSRWGWGVPLPSFYLNSSVWGGGRLIFTALGWPEKSPSVWRSCARLRLSSVFNATFNQRLHLKRRAAHVWLTKQETYFFLADPDSGGGGAAEATPPCRGCTCQHKHLQAEHEEATSVITNTLSGNMFCS